ncbi:MAG: cell division protein FtsW [Bdellovibrio sp. SCN 50-8]|nr:MAG: cell division protein FtsW [Bdellovibrio sp. SCN 50-8]
MGLVQVYSSSYIYASESFGDGYYFFERQILFALLSVGMLIFFSRLPLAWLRNWGWILWFAAGIGVAMALIPGIGVKVGGAHRWLALPFGYRIEPSEFLKVFAALFLATLTVRSETAMSKAPWWLLLVGFVFPLGILLIQPDFGSFTLISCLIMSLLFVQGLKWRYIVSGLAMILPAFYFLVMQVPYRKARVMSFLDPWADPEQKGFQVIQSLLSFSSGGLSGVGLGQGQGKLFFLPEAHTDFTLAVLGEEAGFLGFMVVMSLYGLLILKGLQVAARAEDRFMRSLAVCVTSLFAMNVFVNVGVALGMLPTKGLTLPFLSYGGSSVVAMGILFGLLLNIERSLNDESSRA